MLVAPAAVTHGVDMNQRHVELSVLGRVPGKGLVNAASLKACWNLATGRRIDRWEPRRAPARVAPPYFEKGFQ